MPALLEPADRIGMQAARGRGQVDLAHTGEQSRLMQRRRWMRPNPWRRFWVVNARCSGHAGTVAKSGAKKGPLFDPRFFDPCDSASLRIARDVVDVFAREKRFWRLVEACRRGLETPQTAARYLVPLRQRSLWVVERYIETAARITYKDWPADITAAGKHRAIVFELANLGGTVLRIGSPNPYGRRHAPHPQLAAAIELLERVLGRRCPRCGADLPTVRPRRTRPNTRPRGNYYCDDCRRGNEWAAVEWIAADQKRLKRLLRQAELVVRDG